MTKQEAEQLVLNYREVDEVTGEEYGFRITKYFDKHFDILGAHIFDVVKSTIKDPQPGDYYQCGVAPNGYITCNKYAVKKTQQEAEQLMLAYRTIEDTGKEYGYRIIKYLGEYDDTYYFECVRSDIEIPEPRDYIWFTVGALYGVINVCPRKKMEPISKEEAEQLMQKYLDEENAEWGGDLRITQYLGGGPHEHYFQCLDGKCKEPTPWDYIEFSVSDSGHVLALPR